MIMTVADLEVYANIFLGILLAISQIKVWRQLNGVCWKWIKLVSGLLGIYWAGVYIVVALTAPGDYLDPVRFGQIFIRPALTVTLGVMCAGALLRQRCD